MTRIERIFTDVSAWGIIRVDPQHPRYQRSIPKSKKNMPGTDHASWTERLCLDGDFMLGENGNTLTLGKKDDSIMSDWSSPASLTH